MIKRTDKFTGETGEYITVYNALIRKLGKVETNILRESKDTYGKLTRSISKAAQEHKLVFGQDVLHPNWKVPAYYGMTDDMAKKLEEKNSKLVFAYKTDWTFKWLEDFFND